MDGMEPKVARGERTRAKIAEAATALFTRFGFADVSIEAVLAETGVSRGALYHHYSSKEALFGAVLEIVEARVARVTAAAASEALTPLAGLRMACRAWIELAANDAEVRRIVLIDAPSVVGWEAWRALDARYALGALVESVAAIGGTAPEALGTRTLAHLVLAALVEAALLVSRTPDAETIRTVEAAFDRILDALVPPAGL